MKLFKKHLIALPFLLLTWTCLASEPIQIVSDEITLEPEQKTEFSVEWPATSASKDAELEVVGWIRDEKFRGHCPVLKVLWDGEELKFCSNRGANLVMNDGRSNPSVSEGRWSLPYGPNKDAIETDTENPYFVPSVGEEIVALKFALSDVKGGKHRLEIIHANPGIPQSVAIESVKISEAP